MKELNPELKKNMDQFTQNSEGKETAEEVRMKLESLASDISSHLPETKFSR